MKSPYMYVITLYSNISFVNIT